MAKIGIIGGSGLYDIEGLEKVDQVTIGTPFGPPSDNYTTGELEGTPVVFLPRHGRGHHLNPTEINYTFYSEHHTKFKIPLLKTHPKGSSRNE